MREEIRVELMALIQDEVENEIERLEQNSDCYANCVLESYWPSQAKRIKLQLDELGYDIPLERIVEAPNVLENNLQMMEGHLYHNTTPNGYVLVDAMPVREHEISISISDILRRVDVERDELVQLLESEHSAMIGSDVAFIYEATTLVWNAVLKVDSVLETLQNNEY